MKIKDIINEGEIVPYSELQKRRAEKEKKHYHPDIEPPKNPRPPHDPFVRFEVEPKRNIGIIVGITEKGEKVPVQSTELFMAEALVEIYNSGGYSKHKVERVPFGQD